LAAHTNDWVGTISQDYRGLTVHEIPPNGQGIVCLMALGILSNFDVADYPVDSPDSVHLQIEAVKLAFADAYRFVGDSKAIQVAPKKRPFHTIIPGFVTRNGAPVMSFGLMGGSMQPQGHTQMMVRMADYGQGPQGAIDGPRFRVVKGLEITFEDEWPGATIEE